MSDLEPNRLSADRSNRSEVSERPDHRRTLWILATLTYVVGILLFALIASKSLHDWARLRILDASILGRVDTLVPLPSRDGDAPTAAAQDVTTVDSASVAVEAGQATAAFEPINILLVGTDARPDEQGPPLTDTLILLSLDPNTMTAGMLSLPRDLWVPLPGLDTTTKINLAYRMGEAADYTGGGPQLVKDTVSSIIGRPVQYYVRVSFDGFTEIVDLIGGVDVVVPSTIHDEEYPTDDYGVEVFHLDAGTQHLDGETALKYVRTRNVDSDYGRARRQQQVVRALADKVLRADMLPTLIAKAPRLLYTMRSSIDTDMPMAVQLDLANFVADNSVNEIRQLVLDSRYGEETYSEEGAWILVPDRTRVRAAVNTFFSPAPGGGGESIAAVGTPDWIRVEILNGTTQPGVAAKTRDLLQARGWQVISIGDADRSDYSHTLIVNYGVPEPILDRLSSDLALNPNISTLDGLDPTRPVDMRIVVGTDFLDALR